MLEGSDSLGGLPLLSAVPCPPGGTLENRPRMRLSPARWGGPRGNLSAEKSVGENRDQEMCYKGPSNSNLCIHIYIYIHVYDIPTWLATNSLSCSFTLWQYNDTCVLFTVIVWTPRSFHIQSWRCTARCVALKAKLAYPISGQPKVAVSVFHSARITRSTHYARVALSWHGTWRSCVLNLAQGCAQHE